MSRKKELTQRYKDTIHFALDTIKQSELGSHIHDVLLYGSCARREQKWDSDVDLFIILADAAANLPGYRQKIHSLKSALLSGDNIVEINAKIVTGNDWQDNISLYYKNVRREGISIWH